MVDSPHNVMPFPEEDGQSIVYVRVATPDELPSDVDVDGPVYSVHDSSGNRLALAADRNLAFALARQNDLTPMSVH